MAVEFGSGLGAISVSFISRLMPAATSGHIELVRASLLYFGLRRVEEAWGAAWGGGAFATLHLTLTRSCLRSSRQTGMVLMTLRCHAGDLAMLSAAVRVDNDKDHLHLHISAHRYSAVSPFLRVPD